ncbi:MAG: DUF2950 family protein [Victivallales bacterium]
MVKLKYFLIAVAFSLLISGCASVKPGVGQVVFSTPEEAVAALSDAAGKNDAKRLIEIFGPEGKDIVYSGDEKYDVESRAYFAKKIGEKANLVRDGKLIFVEIGNDNWPFAVPLAIYDGKAFFYTEGGIDELINRRIGRNELNAIRVCRTIASSEEEYARMKLAAGAVKEYSSKFFGDPNAKDGLYWDNKNKDAKEKTQLGALIVLASQDVPAESRKPYYGYFYKILTAQGPAAPGGKKSYLVDGKMKKGFALLAYPASYGISGITTFIVSKTGVVFEKDLGDDTSKLAADMTEYNPDDTWEPVED